MKTEELTALGLNEEQAQKVFALHGKDIEAFKAQNATLAAEKAQAEEARKTAEDALKGFEGKTPEEIKTQIAEYEQKAKDVEAKYTAQLLKRDQSDWLKTKFDEYGVTSPYARKSLEAECTADKGGLSWKDGAFLGFDDYMKKAKEKDGTLYQTKEEKEEQAAKGGQKKPPVIVGKAENEPGANVKFVPPKVF